MVRSQEEAAVAASLQVAVVAAWVQEGGRQGRPQCRMEAAGASEVEGDGGGDDSNIVARGGGGGGLIARCR